MGWIGSLAYICMYVHHINQPSNLNFNVPQLEPEFLTTCKSSSRAHDEGRLTRRRAASPLVLALGTGYYVIDKISNWIDGRGREIENTVRVL